jgi:uncharacterized protein (DUF433 family)
MRTHRTASRPNGGVGGEDGGWPRASCATAAVGLTAGGQTRTLDGMDYRHRSTIEPGQCGGKPCSRGLRITVSAVLDYLASGMSEDDVIRDVPDLTRDEIRASLAFAADRESRRAAPGVN